VSGALGALSLFGATLARSGGWALVAMVFTGLAQGAWAFRFLSFSPNHAAVALAGLGITAAMFIAWPLAFGERFSPSTWVFRAAALAGLVWFFPLRLAWITTLGPDMVGLMPAGLGALVAAAGAVLAVRSRGSAEERRAALIWLFGAAIAAATVAVPMLFDNEWRTIGWAIEAAVLLALWRRYPHAGMKYAAVLLLAVVTLRLVANPGVLAYHARPEVPILNWLLPTYGVPALCLLAGFGLLRAREVERAAGFERGIYARKLPILAMGCVAAAVVVMFVWLNLAVVNAYATGPSLSLTLAHQPDRDLVLSISWAIYALALLGVGMRWQSAGLRWMSLGLVLITAGKVFLYDLAHLRDLYRVASLVGLALSLLLISLAYQRFVFRKAGT
jgi:uncharacterized membrane protein